MDETFRYKCICHWSKNDEFGFIPEINCPVHGKGVKKMLKRTIPYVVEESLDKKKKKEEFK